MEEQDFLLEKIKALEMTKAAKEGNAFENEDINEKDEIIQDLETQVDELKEKLEANDTELQVRHNSRSDTSSNEEVKVRK